MRTIALIAAALALSAGGAVAAKSKLTGEEKLAKLLKGREAGEPVDCIPISLTRETRVIDKTAIIYDNGSVIYVNRTDNPQSLDDNDILVTELRTSQLCKVDIVKLRDRTGQFETGFVNLGDFVPYRKVARDR